MPKPGKIDPNNVFAKKVEEPKKERIKPGPPKTINASDVFGKKPEPEKPKPVPPPV